MNDKSEKKKEETPAYAVIGMIAACAAIAWGVICNHIFLGMAIGLLAAGIISIIGDSFYQKKKKAKEDVKKAE